MRVTWSDVQGGWTGTGNIAMDPLFLDTLGPDGIGGTGDEDFRVGAGSPCIDSGNNTLLSYLAELGAGRRSRTLIATGRERRSSQLEWTPGASRPGQR